MYPVRVFSLLVLAGKRFCDLVFVKLFAHLSHNRFDTQNCYPLKKIGFKGITVVPPLCQIPRPFLFLT